MAKSKVFFIILQSTCIVFFNPFVGCTILEFLESCKESAALESAHFTDGGDGEVLVVVCMDTSLELLETV